MATYSRHLVFILTGLLTACVSQRPKKALPENQSSKDQPTDSSTAGPNTDTRADTNANTTPREMPDVPAQPFALKRADKGTSLTADDLKSFTANYLKMLQKTRYFSFVSERMHGWPESDPQKRFWYSHWWEYTLVLKQGGAITFLHTQQGSDNIGVPTANLMEGACYARNLWGQAVTDQIIRHMTRGFTAWTMANLTSATDTKGPIIARSFYPESVHVTDGPRKYQIDTSLVRPGVDNDATVFIHIPNNPTWGDIWVKNLRSKDDIGHMLRSLAQLSHCEASVTEATKKDMTDTLALYTKWAKKVVSDGFVITSLDKNLKEYKPRATLARYVGIGNAECNARLAFRLLSAGNPDNSSCGDGISVFGGVAASNDQNRRILESHHEAAVALARKTGYGDLALELADGLGKRMDKTMDGIEKGSPDNGFNDANFAIAMMHANNLGVPLTSREIRWLQGQVVRAVTSYSDLQTQNYDIFNPATPDGKWTFTPYGVGLEFHDIGILLGACASRFRNPEARPVLDCEMVKHFTWDQ